ncbi:hypothetical protein [Stackebrandtia albiflava]|nr:hypothetical protein [Stackebrandtia albiflava]
MPETDSPPPAAVIDLGSTFTKDPPESVEPGGSDTPPAEPAAPGLWRYVVVAAVAVVVAAALTLWGTMRLLTPETVTPPSNSAELLAEMEGRVLAALDGEPELMITVPAAINASELVVVSPGDYRLGLMCGVLSVYREAVPEIIVNVQADTTRGYRMPCPSTLVWAPDTWHFTEDAAMEFTVYNESGVHGYVIYAVLTRIEE